MNVPIDHKAPSRFATRRGAIPRRWLWLELLVAALAAGLATAGWYVALREPPGRTMRVVLPVSAPEPPLNRIKPLSPEQALAVNAAVLPSADAVSYRLSLE